VEVGIMLAVSIQNNQKLDSDTRSYLVDYPNFPFGFTSWTPFTRCNQKGIVAESFQFGQVPWVPEATQHLGADRLDNRSAQQSPVEEPPNQPKKPPVKEPPPKPPVREDATSLD
jgi:hypothetical protein